MESRATRLNSRRNTMIDIQIEEAYLPEVDEITIRAAARATLTQQGTAPSAELTILVSDDAEIQALNLSFMGIDAPTDVLSFPSGETQLDPTGAAFPEVYLGDIIISCPQAAAQAAAGGHPLSRELELLTVHGVLHLLGHDHATADEKERMWAAQAQILAMLGNPLAPA